MKNKKVVNQVYQTTDYSEFRTLDGNRSLNELHVRRLRESFEIDYLFSPIIVNEKHEIIDGQHRCEAAKKLGLPINFIIMPNYGLREVQMLNENMKNWKKEDYLNSYCDLGYPEYIKFRSFLNDFPDLGIVGAEALLSNRMSAHSVGTDKSLKSDKNKKGKYMIRDFQTGKFKVHNYNLAVESAEKIMMIKPYYDGFNRGTFIRSMAGIFKIT